MTEKRIHRLPSIVIDRIAAGEVIEGPSSVVKELLENAVDAGAKKVLLQTRAGGMDEIIVQDNGGGILYEDLADTIERHATSKIKSLEDVERILSFGFRGEALASIASVSLIEIQSCPEGADIGGRVESRGGEPGRPERMVCSQGTRVRVRDLFYATPARKKFIKSERAENQKILKEIRRLALANPHVDFEWQRDGDSYLHLSAGDPFERVLAVMNSESPAQWMDVQARDEGISLQGWISSPEIKRSNRESQYIFVNGRWFEMKYLAYLLKQAYGELMPHGFHPAVVLYLQIDPGAVDVNVHPTKKEVRFVQESRIHSLIIRSVQRRLAAAPVAYSDAALARRFIPSVEDPTRSSFFPPADEQSHLLVAEVPQSPEDSQTSPPESGAAGQQAREAPSHGFPPPKSLRQMGVVFGTYILAESEDGLFLIDQHTAHERVNYEKKRAQFADLSTRTQPLLQPVALNLPLEEINALQESQEMLHHAGFEIDLLGAQSAAVRGVPAFVEPGTEAETLRYLIQRILDGETTIHIFDEYAAMKACKASIKKNDRIAQEILGHILDDLLKCDDPSRCPHGRPTMIRISRESLDRMFLRS
jgi:DNA mismatch repair protein MutL